jgi:hypothetical protein
MTYIIITPKAVQKQLDALPDLDVSEKSGAIVILEKGREARSLFGKGEGSAIRLIIRVCSFKQQLNQVSVRANHLPQAEALTLLDHF